MFDTSKLRGKIIEKYGTLNAFATAMSMTPSTLSGRLHGKSYWDQSEIITALRLLDVDLSEVRDYFFALGLAVS